MDYSAILAVLLLSPVAGFLFNGFRYKKPTYKLSGGVATLAVFVSFICSVILFSELMGMNPEQRKIHVKFFEWIAVDKFKVDAGFYVDQISGIMILIITGVGTLIHLFSTDYMHHDKGVTKYFSYLNLFVFNMLILVLGDSLLTLFVGWEGVGLCSYLLIGFWFSDKEKAAAGMKAFITNRVGDAAFLIGMFVLFATFGTINIQDINSLAPTVAESSWLGALTLGTLFLFIGATGKSAQIPLYVWLPDAMAGPTPVSALIHAATMVTAGIYMIVRLNPIFIMAPNTMLIISSVGAVTAFMAASIGITQWDIKKVLAYSTVSQLGYMFLAVGVGAFGAGLFHLMTHAFFKALMFLGSGSVIHAMNEEQDIRKMGGLKKYMPITHWTFFFGWLAIIGIPPFAGFFSKDEILWMSFHSPLGHPALWAIAVVSAAMTAFYMTRLMCLTFWGKSRVPKSVHPHESPALMTIPLVVLAVLSICGGWLGVPEVIGHSIGHIPNFLMEWLNPVIKPIPNLAEADHVLEWGLMGASLCIAIISASIAYHFYVRSPETPAKIANTIKPVYDLIYKKYLVDELYQKTIINPLVEGSKRLWYHVDVNFIDKITYIISDIIKGGGGVSRALQTGNVQMYAMYIALGLVLALSIIIMK